MDGKLIERWMQMTTTDKKYNGWTNYETWVVKLWMDNDEGSYRYWQETAEELWDDNERDSDEFCRAMADRLKDEHEASSQDILVHAHATSSVFSDLIGAALSEVNWYEIAESYVSELPEKETEEANETE